MKGNQESLLSDARDCFSNLKDRHPVASSTDTGDGRKETRTDVVASDKALGEYHEFPGLKGLAKIQPNRETSVKVTSQMRNFALSWIPTPEALLTMVRDHWAIENALHWQLDVSFREDAARNRKDNVAVLRRRALDVVRRDTSKGSLTIKLKRAGWDEALCSILNGLAEGLCQTRLRC